jgi:hypothetical protein
MTRQARSEQSRPKRVSVAEQRNKLTVYGLDHDNFYYRWVNDIDDRLGTFIRAGYEFVKGSEVGEVGDPTVETSQGTDSRVSKGVGGGTKAFLMKIPREIFNEDQAAKEADILETERAMRRSKNESQHQHAQDADIVNVKISSVRGRERIR